MKKKFNSGLIIVSSINDNKISIVVTVTKDISARFNAIKILHQIINYLDGEGGGGRADLAQGGAVFSKKFDSLEEFIKTDLVL